MCPGFPPVRRLSGGEGMLAVCDVAASVVGRNVAGTGPDALQEQVKAVRPALASF